MSAVLLVDDADALFAYWTRRGLVRIAVFEDLCGNLWGLVQFADKPPA